MLKFINKAYKPIGMQITDPRRFVTYTLVVSAVSVVYTLVTLNRVAREAAIYGYQVRNDSD